MQRRQLHVAGAAQDRGKRVHQPRRTRRRRRRSAYSRPPAPARCRGRRAVPAAAGPKISMPSMKVSPKQAPISSACAASVEARVVVAGAERARDRRRHAAAHGAARHRHGQDHERKHQRHRRQRFDAEPADIGGLGDHHAGAGAERDDIRARPATAACAGSGRRPAHSLTPRLRREAAAPLRRGDGNFGNADIGQFVLPPDPRAEAGRPFEHDFPLSSTIVPDSHARWAQWRSA